MVPPSMKSRGSPATGGRCCTQGGRVQWRKTDDGGTGEDADRWMARVGQKLGASARRAGKNAWHAQGVGYGCEAAPASVAFVAADVAAAAATA